MRPVAIPSRDSRYHLPGNREPVLTLLTALRYYWITTKGYRLRPWRSPYIRWRMETFFGKEAEQAHDARGFFRLVWRERARMWRFLRWVDERWHEQNRRRRASRHKRS